ncbi:MULTISPECIES: hypothetical protein [Sorangium]|uniref:AAA domain-containing protein n=1 Tax=Sorangium cellulosum TaxID=56 RepID=A0A4P2R4T1_SORCE|nr:MULTISPECIES: hypothetical protein [Sorangium]AUX37013.1 uncharacterized protein SOCE836_092320 [Sorangium cellulosum]WCQ96306.1 hypothetical protein NQZ70_09091 [Sorangium sp. Soce836]
MARFFNTAGPCRPDLHYMVDPLRRIERLHRLIDRQSYFVVHGPRQTGKTMSLLSLAAALVQEGRYAAALLSLEVGRAFPEDVGAAESAILQSFRDDAAFQLPPDQRPPPWPDGPPGHRLADALAAFQLTCGQPSLVNALARAMVDELVPDRSVTLLPAHVRAARDAIVLRQDTHLDSLAKRLRDDRVRTVIESIITGSSLGAVPDDDQRYAMDLGLVRQAEGGVLGIANPIYREIFQGRLSAAAVARRAIDRWREENASRLLSRDELDAVLSAERDSWGEP